MVAANNEVSRDNPEMLFVTAFAGILELATGELAYCNAGHENPYLLPPDGGALARIADGDGPPLCAVDGYVYHGAERRLRPGEVLCVITAACAICAIPAASTTVGQGGGDARAHCRDRCNRARRRGRVAPMSSLSRWRGAGGRPHGAGVVMERCAMRLPLPRRMATRRLRGSATLSVRGRPLALAAAMV
jgi:hypothetical protein